MQERLVCGLDHHSPIEDDQIQLDLEGCAEARVGRHVLEVVARNWRHVAFGYAGETGVLEAWVGIQGRLDASGPRGMRDAPTV